MANILSNLDGWEVLPASNQPDGLDQMTVVDDLRQIQATVRKYLASKANTMASAATVDLSAATGSYVEISGTSTIVSFGTLGAGLTKLVKFTGILQLTYNATSMILPTLANITTEAGDTCLLVSLGGGNWQVLMYQRASGQTLYKMVTSIDTVAADATTTQLWNYSHIQNWTGTPTITDLPDAPQIGANRVVYPAAGTVFTNNSNLSVQGGANYTVEAGDKITIYAKTISTFDVFIERKNGLPVNAYLSQDSDFSSAVLSGTANALYTENITIPKGLYLIHPYVVGWTYANVGGSYFMTAFAEFIAGTGISKTTNIVQTGVHYQTPPFVLRITSETATLRLGFKNNGSSPPGQGTITLSADGAYFYGIRLT